MSFPEYFSKLFAHIAPIQHYIANATGLDWALIQSGQDRRILEEHAIDRLFVAQPHYQVVYDENSGRHSTAMTMSEVVESVRRDILTAGKGNDHVLTSGTYLSLEKDDADQRVIEVKDQDAAISEMTSPLWDAIFRHTSGEIVRHMLMNTVVLERMPQGGYRQLSGTRVTVLMNRTNEELAALTAEGDEMKVGLSKIMYNTNFAHRPQALLKSKVIEQLQLMFPKEFAEKKRQKFPKRLDKVKSVVDCIIQRNALSNPTPILASTCRQPKGNALAEMATPPKAIYQFAVIHTKKVFPIEFWGSQRNFLAIMKVMKRFFNLKKRETIDIADVLKDFQVLDCTWLAPPQGPGLQLHPDELSKRQALLRQAVMWFFKDYLSNFIKSHFYITESSTGSNRVAFYLADVWMEASKPFLEATSSRYEKVLHPPADAQAAKLRVVPKGNTMRPITNMSIQNKKEKSKLESTLQILANMKERQQQKDIGKSVVNVAEIFAKLSAYKESVFAQGKRPAYLESSSAGSRSAFYFVKTDIEKSFDSIDQQLLLEILGRLLHEESYVIKSYQKSHLRSGRFYQEQEYVTDSAGESSSASDLELLTLTERFTETIFEGGASHTTESSESLLQCIEKHIKDNLVKIGDDTYRQKVGIPQGSRLSTMLCHFFYADMERECLSFIKQDSDALLLRYVDDFLLISPKVATIELFCDFIHTGADKYGTTFSAAKSVTTLRGRDTKVPVTLERELRWCGLKIDVETLDVYSDFSRYTKNNVRDLMTLRFGLFYKNLEQKLIQTLKTKQQPILTDLDFNSDSTVYRNFYESYLLIAIKFAAYCSEVSRHDKQKKIQGVALYSILLRVHSMTTVSLSPYLDRSILRVLMFKAFITILSRKHSFFHDLLQLLKAKYEGMNHARKLAKKMTRLWPECELVRLPIS